MDKNYNLSVGKAVENPDEHMTQFVGKWGLLRKDNFDEFLKASGINFILRKAANALIPVEILEETGKKQDNLKPIWRLKTETILKSASADFALLEPFPETTIDGRKMKTTFSVEIICDDEGATFYALVQRQVDSAGRNIEIIRFIRNDILNVIMTVGDTKASAQFEPLK